MSAVDDTRAEVERTKEIDQSVKTLLEGVAQRIEDAGVDQTALTNLTADLRASNDDLAAAVVANTPADPSAPPVEEPPVDTTPPPAETGTNPDGSLPPDQPTDGTGAADQPLPEADQPPAAGLNPDGSEVDTSPNIPEGTEGVDENFISAGESSPETGGQITPEQ